MADKARKMAPTAATSEGQPVLDTDALEKVLEEHRAAAEPATVEALGGSNASVTEPGPTTTAPQPTEQEPPK